jgi:hypothetical protein
VADSGLRSERISAESALKNVLEKVEVPKLK